MAKDLGGLTRASFEPHVDTTFSAIFQGRPVTLVLAEAVDRTPAGFNGEQFSILFQGPPEPFLPQQIHEVRHPVLGTLELFLVPVGREDAGIQYEAFFNRFAE